MAKEIENYLYIFLVIFGCLMAFSGLYSLLSGEGMVVPVSMIVIGVAIAYSGKLWNDTCISKNQGVPAVVPQSAGKRRNVFVQ